MTSRNDKGKAAVAVGDNSGGGPSDDSLTLLGRIGASANTLTRDLFSAPLTIDPSTAAASFMKGQNFLSPYGGTSDVAESSKTARPITTPRSRAACLKMMKSEEHFEQSDAEFSSFLNDMESLSSASTASTSVTLGGNNKNPWEETWTRAMTVEGSIDPTSAYTKTAVVKQEMDDGFAVSRLLSSPSWISKDFEMSGDEDLQTYDWALGQQELAQVALMTKPLGLPDQHENVHVGPPLNFVPVLPEEERVIWIRQWEAVLTRYTDEVWGGMLPLVKEARKEVEEVRSNVMSIEKLTAVRRLKAVLRHVQRYD